MTLLSITLLLLAVPLALAAHELRRRIRLARKLRASGIEIPTGMKRLG